MSWTKPFEVWWWQSDDSKLRKIAFLLIGLLTAFRLFYSQVNGLVADEAYYWLWSKHLDWCYFSKGPGVAWTIAGGTAVFGDTVFGIRWPAVLLGAGTALGFFSLTERLFDTRTAFVALIFAALIPLFMVGGFLMTIDPLSVFFWVAAAWTFWEAVQGKGWGWWPVTGLLVGLGMLAKFTNAVQLLGFVLVVAWHRPWRHHLRGISFWSMVFVALVCLTPVLLWNMAHGWPTAKHLVHRGALDSDFSVRPGEFISFLLGQALVIHPLIFIGAGVALFYPLKEDRWRGAWRFSLCLFLPLMVFYFALSLNRAGQLNWTAPAWIGGLICLAAAWRFRANEVRWGSFWFKSTLITGGVAWLVLHAMAWTSTLPPLKRHPLERLRRGPPMVEGVRSVMELYPASFVIADKYSVASLLAFYSQRQWPIFMPNEPRITNQFSFWPGYDHRFIGQDALFVSEGDEIPDSFRREFLSVRLVEVLDLQFQGTSVGKIHVFLCRGFTGETELSPVAPNRYRGTAGGAR